MHSKGLEGKKGVLWWDIHKPITANVPRYVFLENVDRLLKSPSNQRGRICHHAQHPGSLGYVIEWRVVNAAEYGFPQRRKRVFIVATKIATAELDGFDPMQCIVSKGVLARALPVKRPTTKVHEISLQESPDVLSQSFGSGSQKSPFLNSGVFVNGFAHTVTTEPRQPRKIKTLGHVLQQQSVPESFWVDDHRLKQWQAHKGAKKIQRAHKASGTEYVYAEELWPSPTY